MTESRMKSHGMSWLLALLFLVCSPSIGVAQTADKKISYSCKNERISVVFDKIERLSRYYKLQFQTAEVVNYRVTADIKEKTVPEAVRQVIGNAPLQMRIDRQYIYISEVKKPRYGIQISGYVTDEEGEPLIGVTVRNDKDLTGTVTDVDGFFHMHVAQGTPLQFSYIGKKSVTVKAPAPGKQLNVKLVDEGSLMNEVVVTGYQNIKRENATGAYQQISSKEMERRYTSDVISNLEGKIPGMISYNTGLNSDAESNIQIRGVSTFTSQTKPLVVVDGLPIEGSIETVNPYEIESITVLKDAAAASIYGARASNGVIVVTTKKAHNDKVDIQFSADLTVAQKQRYGNYGWASAAEVIEMEEHSYDAVMADPTYSQYLPMYQMMYPSYINPVLNALIARGNGTMTDAEYQQFKANLSKNDYVSQWRDKVLTQKVTQQYNLALRTRSKHLSSSIVANYKRTNPGIKNEWNQDVTLAYRGDVNINRWLSANVGLNVISTRGKNHADELGLLTSPTMFPAYTNIYNADGSRAYYMANVSLDEPNLSNPSLGLKDMGYNLEDELARNYTRTRNNNVRSFIHLNAKVLPELTITGAFQYENIDNQTKTYLEADSYDMRYIYNLFTVGGTHNVPEGGILSTYNRNADYYTFRAQANFNKTFGEKHAVEAIAGAEARQVHYTTNRNKLFGYNDATQTNSTTQVNLNQLRRLTNGYNFSDMGSSFVTYTYRGLTSGYGTSDVTHRYTSLYLTGNYTYDQRYSASVSYRVDKADLFGADPKYRGRPLWSVGASWNIQNEAWMKQYTWIDALKLRASYGLTGNIDSSVSSYLTAGIYNHYYIDDTKSAYLNTPPNDQLRWEKTASWNLGIDYSFLHNRLSGSLDFYRKNSTDLLSATALDVSSGWRNLTINNGEAYNQGVEMQLNAVILQAKTRDEVGINLGTNWAYNKNKITKITYEPTNGMEVIGWGSSSHTLMEGKPINSIYAWKFAGYEIDNAGNQQILWEKADGTKTNENVYGNLNPDDCVYMGSMDPKFTGSFTPEITWKGFSLSAMFAWYAGHYMRANVDAWTSQGSMLGYGTMGGIKATSLDYWRNPETAVYPAEGVAAMYRNMNAQGLIYNSECVMRADYMKLRNIVLSYAFPMQLCHRLGIGSARLRLQMNNVATWVRNDLGIDPEANNAWTGTTLNKAPHSYTLSLNVGF